MREINAILTIAFRDVIKFLRDVPRIVATFVFPFVLFWEFLPPFSPPFKTKQQRKGKGKRKEKERSNKYKREIQNSDNSGSIPGAQI